MRLLLRLQDKQLSCVNLSHIIKTSLLSDYDGDIDHYYDWKLNPLSIQAN